jgi:hypothetical protein
MCATGAAWRLGDRTVDEAVCEEEDGVVVVVGQSRTKELP